MRILSINNSTNFQGRIKINKPVATKVALGSGLLTTGVASGLSGVDTVQQANWHIENIDKLGECYDMVKDEGAEMVAKSTVPSTVVSAPISTIKASVLLKSAYKDSKQDTKIPS